MKIHWGRIVIAGLVAQIVGMGLYLIFSSFYIGSVSVAYSFIIIVCFVLMLLGALWVARKIDSRFILHGFLVGVVAVILYVIVSLPVVLRGEYPMNYWLAAVYFHTPKLLGGIVGGYLAGRRKDRN
jgi:putative membrane protein (TIGR04086 family)